MLRAEPRVVVIARLTPESISAAGVSVDVVRHHSKMVLQDVIAYLEQKQPPHLVNPSAWKRFVG